MTTAVEVEQAVRSLPEDEFSLFSSWFVEYEEQRWDQQIKSDQKAGPLLDLMKKARSDFKAGKCRPI